MTADDVTALRDEINRRLTLNWLIQGAAQHAGITLHHLVRDELNALDERLVRYYDQFALVNLLQYWRLEAMLIIGRPGRFWRRAARNPRHPFYGHPILSRHGGALAAAAKRRALERCREKGLTRLPVAFTIQATYLVERLRTIESRHRPALIELAKRAASTAWGIPQHRFEADLDSVVVTRDAFDSLPAPATVRGQVLSMFITGLGGVARRDGALAVVARASNWQLLAKELVKGTRS